MEITLNYLEIYKYIYLLVNIYICTPHVSCLVNPHGSTMVHSPFFQVHLSTLRLHSSEIPPASFSASGGDGLPLKTPRRKICVL